MTQQISVVVKTTGVLAIANGQVADPAGNLWNLPNPTNVTSAGVKTVTATADNSNPAAPWPGSSVTLTIENPQAGWLSAVTTGQVTPIEFRTNFPEFANAGTYPDTMIQFWLTTGYKQCRASVWQDELDLGVQLFTAHNCVLEAQAMKQAATGQSPGSIVGPANSKSVDKVSIAYDTGAGTVPGWGNWNLTNYGTRFKWYVDMYGAGGIQIGAGPPIGSPYWGW